MFTIFVVDFETLRKIRENDGTTGLADHIIKNHNPQEKTRIVLHIPADLRHFLILKDNRGRKTLSLKVAELIMQDVRNHSKIHGKTTII